MATIDPNQTYDIIHTLTFSEASGDCPIRLHRGSSSAISGTVYYRAGTSGDWTSLSVSGTDTTFPVTDTTMQVAHGWNKSGNDYMTPSFQGATNITSIAISQKSSLTGTMGNYFMYYYARDCSSLTSLAVPDTSGLTSVGNYFMHTYARGCSSLTSLDVPDTSGLTSVGNYFMYCYAYGCSSLTSLAVPDTSGLTSVGFLFMGSYAEGCSSLTKLVLPAVGWFEDNNVNWSVPAGRLGVLEGHVLDSDDLSSWQALTVSGKTLYTNYIRNPDLVYYEGVEPAQGEAHITATSKLSVSGRKIAKAEAPVTAITAITAQGKKIAKAQVHITATTALIVSGIGEETQIEQGQAHVKTLSSFDVAGEKRARSPPAVLTGETEVAAEGRKVAKGQVTLTSSSKLSVQGRKSAQQEISFTADSELSAEGRKIAQAEVHLDSEPKIETEGKAIKQGTAEIKALYLIDADGKAIIPFAGTAHIKATSETKVSGRKIVKGEADVTANSETDLTGQKIASGEAKLTANSKLVVQGKAVKQGRAALTATSEITVESYGEVHDITGVAHVKAVSRLSAAGRKIITGKADIKTDSEINAQAKTRRQGQAVIPAISEMAVKGKYEPPYKQLIIGLSVQERQISLSVQEYKVKLEVEGMPLIGDTIRLKGEFKDLDGNLTDIEEPKVVIYDNKRNVIKEATPTKAGTGIYYYDLVVPDYPEAGKRNEPLVFEFSGQLGGQPVVGRSSFERVWNE